MPATVFMSFTVPGETRNSLGPWLHENAPDGHIIRVICGSGRQNDLDAFRTNDWRLSLNDSIMYGEFEGASIEYLQEHGVTISLYDGFSPIRHFRDIGIATSHLYADGQERPNPIYDCLVLNEQRYERFFAISDDTYMDGFGGEFDARAIAFQVPIASVVNRCDDSDVNWDSIFDGDVLETVIDPNFEARREQRQEERNQQAFIEIAQHRDDGELRNIRTRITDNSYVLAQAQREVERSRQELREQQELLDAVLSRRERNLTPEQMLEEYEAIKRHAHVVDLLLHPDRLVVRTNDIELEHPNTGETTIVGRFDITFNLNDGEIRVHNLTNRRGTYDHPHVNNGSFCQGELGPTLIRLVNQRQIGAAVNMAIAALSYCTPEDDWGRHVAWWFGAEDAPEPTVDDDA